LSRLWLALPLLLLAAGAARAEKLTVALSTGRVEISSNFTGTSLVVFGAIERDAATVSRPEGYDVVVIVRGPSQTVVTRRKERTFGIWINRTSETYEAPAFYSAHATGPLEAIALPATLRQYEIGLPALRLDGTPDFIDAFLRLKRNDGLYSEIEGDVRFLSPSIFQAAVGLPANVPVGTYRTTVHLFSGNALLASQEGSFEVGKSGFEQFASTFARNQGLIYGLVTILLALFTGWLAGVIFRRD
jgi:uncharacterized protein (TIGR02186 family)